MSGCGDGLTDRLRDLDEMGIDLQVVMPPPLQCYYTVPIDISVKATQIVNDGIAEYVARKPDRFVALGSVPMTDSLEACLYPSHRRDYPSAFATREVIRQTNNVAGSSRGMAQTGWHI
jgi:hypothetical protein